MDRFFVLSPANLGGPRARMLMREPAEFDLARRLRGAGGVPVGKVFSFVSALYFRGKLAYARAFAARPPADPRASDRVLVIVPGAGLWSVEHPLTIADLRALAGVDVDPANARYRRPLLAAARAMAERLGSDDDVILLGSIASAKYVDVLSAVFAERLKFPAAFVGRGDMSRGGLLLRSVAGGHELDYIPILGAVRHGRRPPKLPPLPGRSNGS